MSDAEGAAAEEGGLPGLRALTVVLARGVLVPWYAAVRRDFWAQPFPTDPPRAHGSGRRPHRVLLIGDGVTHGAGVRTQELSLAGHLARTTSLLSGEAIDVDVRAAANTRDAIALAREAACRRYDAVVVVLGADHVLALRSAESWRIELQSLREELQPALGRSADVLLVEVPPLRVLHGGSVPLGRIVERHRRRLNDISRRVVDEWERARYVPLPAPPSGSTPSGNYKVLADPVAAGLAESLGSRPEGGQDDDPTGDPASDAKGRRRALHRLAILDTPAERVYDRIVQAARGAFSADGASFSLVDAGRQWNKARAGVAEREIPRDRSLCSEVLCARGATVMSDVQGDQRFADVEGIRFYAGHPIEAATGERIGVLCVWDRTPRPRADIDVALLRDFALQLQRELWRRPQRSAVERGRSGSIDPPVG